MAMTVWIMMRLAMAFGRFGVQSMRRSGAVCADREVTSLKGAGHGIHRSRVKKR